MIQELASFERNIYRIEQKKHRRLTTTEMAIAAITYFDTGKIPDEVEDDTFKDSGITRPEFLTI
jgi:hypothetical protein